MTIANVKLECIGYIAAAALLVLALVVAVCLPLARSLRPLAKT